MLLFAILVDAPDAVGATLEQVQQPVTTTGLALRACTDTAAALAELKKQPDGGAKPALILLGPHLEHPVAVARSLHQEAPLVHLIFLAGGDSTDLLRQLKSPVAMVGGYWNIVKPAPEHLATVLQDAVRSARQRHQLRTTLDHINVELASSAPTDPAEQRQYLVSMRFFANILKHAHDAIIAANDDGIIITWNDAAQRLFGLAQDDAIGRPIAGIAGGDWAEQLPPLIAQARTLPDTQRSEELQCRRSDGQVLHVELVLSLVRQESGSPIGFSAVVRDITERKRLEDALRETNQDLERRVEQRTKALTKANEELEHSNIELTRFAYIASHDLQSPLRSISGFVQLLQEAYRGRLDEQADHWIERVIENTQRMRTLINDLLAYSRVNSRARPFTPLALRDVFDDAVAALEVSIRDARAEVTCDNLPEVNGDRSHLVQLLQNLIDNGIKYNEQARPRVHLSARQQGDEWIFSVRDNGIGIEARHIEKIFDIFNRLHPQHRYPGTGIGLAVCRRIARRHGGRLWAESRPGKGSVFCFTLPNTKIEKESPS